MLKVVIIDDEAIIVEGLSRVIKWEEYGCTLVGTAYDGIEGIQVIREQNPDIIFTDIAMPGMDGLQMIASIRVEHPDTMIAILTGYRDFDYAQTAIKLGVNRFLLKPSNLSEIEETIVAMSEKLKKQKQLSGETEQEEQKLEEDVHAEGNAGSFIVKNALAYMEENYKEKVTLSDLADKMYVSQWHLSKLLNKHTKKSFSELMGEIRIKEAKKLLKDPSLRVGDVAEQVGFLDTAHFARVFKQYTGMSANEYRNRKLG
ncbi:MAG: response regulator [Lachnospiraceae bacterium]|nr:response regulator [Lachnospiraceae bacterium]